MLSHKIAGDGKILIPFFNVALNLCLENNKTFLCQKLCSLVYLLLFKTLIAVF